MNENINIISDLLVDIGRIEELIQLHQSNPEDNNFMAEQYQAKKNDSFSELIKIIIDISLSKEWPREKSFRNIRRLLKYYYPKKNTPITSKSEFHQFETLISQHIG